jgi:protein TonB
MNASRIAKTLAGLIAVAALAVGLSAQSQAKPPQEDEFLKGAYLPETPGLVPPNVAYAAKPKYTSEAMRAKIQGQVLLQAVVGVDGRVDRARVLVPLDTELGLDERALEALKAWTFTPARLDGEAVPAAVAVTIAFRLH